MKTVIEIRRSSARDTFIAESVYLVLNSLLDWEAVLRLKQRYDPVSFTFFFSMKRTAQFCMRQRKNHSERRIALDQNVKAINSERLNAILKREDPDRLNAVTKPENPERLNAVIKHEDQERLG